MRSVDLTPFTLEDRAIFDGPSIAEQLPLRFASKGTSLKTFCGHCARCRGKLDGKDLRGRVDRSWDSVAQIAAIGHCRSCNLFTRFEYRVYDDLSLVGQHQGNWYRWVRKPSLAQRAWMSIAGAAWWLVSDKPRKTTL